VYLPALPQCSLLFSLFNPVTQDASLFSSPHNRTKTVHLTGQCFTRKKAATFPASPSTTPQSQTSTKPEPANPSRVHEISDTKDEQIMQNNSHITVPFQTDSALLEPIEILKPLWYIDFLVSEARSKARSSYNASKSGKLRTEYNSGRLNEKRKRFRCIATHSKMRWSSTRKQETLKV